MNYSFNYAQNSQRRTDTGKSLLQRVNEPGVTETGQCLSFYIYRTQVNCCFMMHLYYINSKYCRQVTQPQIKNRKLMHLLILKKNGMLVLSWGRFYLSQWVVSSVWPTRSAAERRLSRFALARECSSSGHCTACSHRPLASLYACSSPPETRRYVTWRLKTERGNGEIQCTLCHVPPRSCRWTRQSKSQWSPTWLKENIIIISLAVHWRQRQLVVGKQIQLLQ